MHGIVSRKFHKIYFGQKCPSDIYQVYFQAKVLLQEVFETVSYCKPMSAKVFIEVAYPSFLGLKFFNK